MFLASALGVGEGWERWGRAPWGVWEGALLGGAPAGVRRGILEGFGSCRYWVYVGRIVEAVGSCRYWVCCSLQEGAGGYDISECYHLKFIVHLLSYGNAEGTFVVEWTELQLLREAIVSDRYVIQLVGMVS